MKRGFNVLGFLFLFGIVLFSMNFVSAANTVTLNTPAASSNLTGTTYLLNATLDTNTKLLNKSWFFVMYSNGTNITIASFIDNVTDTGFNTTWDTNGVVDANGLTFWVRVANATGVLGNTSDTSLGVTVDNTAPVISLLGYTNGTLQNNTNQLTLNISVTLGRNLTAASACRIDLNGTNQTVPITFISTTIGTCNTTVANLTGLTDGNRTINIHVNNSAGLLGLNNSFVTFVDSNGPAVDLSVISRDRNRVTLDISATDAGSGVVSCTSDRGTVSGLTGLTESGLSCGTSYTYTVTCVDGRGNEGAASETLSTDGCGGGTPAPPGPPEEINTWTKITPGVVEIMKNFDSEIGVKEIQITVNNEAQNVRITVTKYDGKPAEVSVEKTGKVYQYLQIDAKNLAGKLNKATVQFRVEKSWASANGLDSDEISVHKFDETSKRWNSLPTNFASEDSTYYYYNVELGSFSYFSIAQGEVTVPGETGTSTTGSGSMTWLWILIFLAIAIVAWNMMRKKPHHH